MKNNIKVVIFDLGGVITSSKIEKILNIISDYIGIEYSKFNDFMEKYKSDLTKGKISLVDVYSKVVKQFGLNNLDDKHIIDKHLEIFQKINENLNEEVLSLVKKLRENYSVVCLVNAEIDVVPLVRKMGIYDYFEHAYISTELEMEKPDPEIYLAVLNDLNCKPWETIFIDDKKENVNSAKKVGMNSILYKNFGQLKKEFKKGDRRFAPTGVQ